MDKLSRIKKLTPEEREKILEKAKETEYKHPKWFKEGGKSVYDAVSYYQSSGDFTVRLRPSRMSVGKIEGLEEYMKKHKIQRELGIGEVANFCINEGLYSNLAIIYLGREKGQDTGKLKIQTFMILEGKL